MAKYMIKGDQPLKGTIKASGNKNAILPIMAASLLTPKECFLENVPQINDVLTMGAILKDLGAKVEGLGTDKLVINAKGVNKAHLDDVLVRELRASILLLGPLLGRFGKAKMRHPGGCIIGRRAVGTHFQALKALGAKTITTDLNYESEVKSPKATEIFLEEVSVTATENALMMVAAIPGVTVIKNAACEPHVEDLANFIGKMGVKVSGAGSNQITIEGKKNLEGAKHRIVPDHIEVGTFAILGAITKGRIRITDVRREHLQMTLLYFQKIGLEYEFENGSLSILPSKLVAPKGKIQTRPWPGFPTDLMSPFIVLATQAEGTTLCHDWMFESRMFFVDKLINMGADITLCDPHRVLVTGPCQLKGRELESPDIRAGIALVLAALAAEGKSVIDKAELIERGYQDIESRLKSLGAKIKKVAK